MQNVFQHVSNFKKKTKTFVPINYTWFKGNGSYMFLQVYVYINFQIKSTLDLPPTQDASGSLAG